MWIKRGEYIDILMASNARGVKVDFLESELKEVKETNRKIAAIYRADREKLMTALARVSELENKILELNDALNIARKAAVPLASLNLAEMFEDEDQVKVNELRERIKAEGADIVLAEAVEK